MRTEGTDVIYSSSPPESAHLLGMWLKKYSGKPWIMDLRDPWTFEPLNRYLVEDRTRRNREEKLERRCFELADLIVINTPEAAERYGEVYPGQAAKMQVVTNGFDSEEFALVEDNYEPLEGIDGSTFVMSHTGSFSRHTDKDISPEPLLEALSKLLKRGTLDPEQHKVVFAGATGPAMKSCIGRLKLTDLVYQAGTVSHIDAVRIMMRSNLLVLYDQSERAEYYIRGKLYEYLAAGKRILGIVPPGAARRLLESSGQGIFALPGSSEDIARAITEALDERDDPVPAPGFDIGIYDRERIAERMAGYLDRLTNR
jgi:glycosyltransferase involved in cell wall biosynthesis